jgi:hypothetical protein
VLLEALQCLESDHIPNPFAALSSVGGVLVALPLVVLLIPREPETLKAADQIGPQQN